MSWINYVVNYYIIVLGFKYGEGCEVLMCDYLVIIIIFFNLFDFMG